MDSLDEALGKLLNDPGAMAQVMNLAQSLGAGLPQETKPVEAQPDPGNLLRTMQGDDRQTALFRALGSYLPPKRREKLERAMRIAKLSSLARTALAQTDREE